MEAIVKTEKKVKEIGSIKQWYKAATKAVAKNAAEFLSQTRVLLTDGEHSGVTRPIFTQYDWNSIPAHKCVEALFTALIAFDAQQALRKAIEAGEADNKRFSWQVTIFGGKRCEACRGTGTNCQTCKGTGNFDQELKNGQRFNSFKEASGWCDRRVAEGGSDWHGVIEALKGESTCIQVDRLGAMYRLNVERVGPVMKPSVKGSGSRLWCKSQSNCKVYFSRG